MIQDELVRICEETHQTVFMITHDVDEAILLADRIFLMSNGPRARVAEIVVNTLPRDRTRDSMHHDPQYYRIRNHLLDFLVRRSHRIQQASNSAAAEVQGTGGTVTVYPGLEEEGVAAPSAPAAVPELVRREPIALAGKAA